MCLSVSVFVFLGVSERMLHVSRSFEAGRRRERRRGGREEEGEESRMKVLARSGKSEIECTGCW